MAPVVRRPGEWPWSGRVVLLTHDKADRNVGDAKREARQLSRN